MAPSTPPRRDDIVPPLSSGLSLHLLTRARIVLQCPAVDDHHPRSDQSFPVLLVDVVLVAVHPAPTSPGLLDGRRIVLALREEALQLGGIVGDDLLVVVPLAQPAARRLFH